jgi:uncharacterized protein YpmS
MKGNKLILQITILPFLWLPFVERFFLQKDSVHSWKDFCIFIVIYLGALGLLYLILSKLIISRKTKFTMKEMPFGILFLLLVQNILIIGFHEGEFFVSTWTYLLTILLSCIIALFCLMAIIRLSKKQKRSDIVQSIANLKAKKT